MKNTTTATQAIDVLPKALGQAVKTLVPKFIKASKALKAIKKDLAMLYVEHVSTYKEYSELNKCIRLLAEEQGYEDPTQTYRQAVKFAIEHLDWEKPLSQSEIERREKGILPSEDKKDGRRKAPPVVKSTEVKTTVEDLIRQALANACMELSDSELLSLISKENRVKSTISIEVRARFNKHLMKVLNGK